LEWQWPLPNHRFGHYQCPWGQWQLHLLLTSHQNKLYYPRFQCRGQCEQLWWRQQHLYENDQCSGNQSEVRQYSVSAASAGNYTLKALCRSHEGPGVNGGGVQTLNVGQTSVNNYVEVTPGTASFNAGGNTVSLSSGQGFVCFRKVCIEGGSGGSNCNFSVSASNSNATPSCGASITLTANCTGSDCGAVSYNWSGNGLNQSGASVTANVPSSNGTTPIPSQPARLDVANQSANTGIAVSNCGGGSSNCSAESLECSGNQYEVRQYSVSAANAGNYTIKTVYRSHEGPGIIRWQVNGGSVQTLNVAQTGVNEYILVTLGTASLNAGSNTVSLSSGQGFVCFKQAYIQSALRQGVAEETTTDEVLTLYPNPTDGRVTMRYQLAKGEVATLRFVNVSGQVLERKALVGEGG